MKNLVIWKLFVDMPFIIGDQSNTTPLLSYSNMTATWHTHYQSIQQLAVLVFSAQRASSVSCK